jgi:aryl-alcohol dehydrogenase-like predicted oxidoreductase
MRSFAIPGIAVPATELCLGTGSFGSAIPRDEAFAQLDAFAAAGGTFLDTAHIYAAWLPDGAGASERTIGDWLASRGGRARMLVATKGGHPDLAPGSPGRLRPADIERDLRESLDRLRLERVDLYWLHRDDRSVPVGEILTTLDGHIRGGRIRAIGASNWTPARLQEAAEWAAAHDVAGFAASSIGWALARAVPERIPPGCMTFMDEAQLAWYRRSGVPVVAYSAQANGFFAKPEKPPGLYDMPGNAQRRARVAELARARGVSPNVIALAWLLGDPACGSAIVGPRTLDQLRDSLRAPAIRLDERERMRLDLADVPS